MKWNQFSRELSDRAQKHKEEANADAIWKAIEPEVDAMNKKGGKRRFFFIFFFGALFVSAAAFLFLERGKTNPVNSNKNEFQENHVDTHSIQIGQQENISNKVKATDTKKSTPSNADKVSENYSTEYSKNSTANKSITSDRLSNAEMATLPSKNQIQNQRTSKSKELEQRIKFEHSTKNSDPSNINYSSSLSDRKIIELNQSSQLEIKVGAQSNVSIPKKNAKHSEIEKKFSLFVLPQLLPKEIVSSSTISLQSLLTRIHDNAMIDFNTNIPRVSKQDPAIQIALGIYGGLSATNRSLDGLNANSNDLLAVRNGYTKALEANHLGLSINLHHSSGLYLSTGVQRTSMVEQYKIQETRTTIDSVPGVVVYRKNVNGDTVAIMGMIPRTTNTTFDKRIYNTHNLFDIPLLIGYQIKKSENWNIAIQGGALLNLSLQSEGYLPSVTLEDINIEEEQNQLYKTKLGLRYTLGLNANRKLTDKLDLTLGLSTQYFPNTITADVNEISQKYTLFGGQLGLRYRLD